MAILTHATFHFNWLMAILIFGIRAPGAWRTTERPGLIGLNEKRNSIHDFDVLVQGYVYLSI